MINISKTICIPDHEVHCEFVSASGPGGQNVNKVATAVKLRFDVANSAALPGNVKQKLLTLSRKRITREGIVIIDARRYRTQERNRQDALERLADIIKKALYVPEPRKKTSPTKVSKKKRLEHKKRRSVLKKNRQMSDLFGGE
jgi:ribosome-associated protein